MQMSIYSSSHFIYPTPNYYNLSIPSHGVFVTNSAGLLDFLPLKTEYWQKKNDEIENALQTVEIYKAENDNISQKLAETQAQLQSKEIELQSKNQKFDVLQKKCDDLETKFRDMQEQFEKQQKDYEREHEQLKYYIGRKKTLEETIESMKPNNNNT